MMVYGAQSSHKIGELSEVAAARRAGAELSQKLGFDAVRSGELAIIITEAATNIGKHANSGHIYLRSISSADKNGVEVLAVDSGPGMRNADINFEDGNSSTGTYGVGLGAIKRLSHYIDIYTEYGKGTALLMIIWATDEEIAKHSWEIGSMCIPLASEDVCGDAWSAILSETGLSVVVADGLGHGQRAADASSLAVKALQDDADLFPNRILQNSHTLMKGSRGAAVAIVKIDTATNELRYSGIGNIAGCIYSNGSRQHLLSHNGIVGTNMHKTQEFVHQWPDDAIVIMHSDGIGTKWAIENYTGLEKCHPSVIAAVIHRDHTRGRDDSTIVVFKRAGAY